MNILIVNRSSSKCASCGKGADPHDIAHNQVIGYDVAGEFVPGCGAVYTHVTTHYMGAEIAERVRQMRPDLTFIDYFGEGLTGENSV